jgi:SAM-dependent methyltransferase
LLAAIVGRNDRTARQSGAAAAPRVGAGAEFDQYANGYSAGMENWVKRLAGYSADGFIDVKVRWLLEQEGRLGRTQAATRLLDFGCGTGLFLKRLRHHGFAGRLRGCDVAAEMIAEASRTWTAGPRPALDHFVPPRLPYADRQFDIVVASAVLHHVPPAEREPVYREISRVLVPGGRLYVFEHNPLNPVTQYVVRNTPIDRHAVLLLPSEVKRGMTRSNLVRRRSRGLMFFPPRWRALANLEHWLRWLPLGGQYVVTGEKR